MSHKKPIVSFPNITPTTKAKNISTFCQEHGFSVATFYRNIDIMPNTVLIGRLRRILIEDEVEWHKKLRSGEDE